jgi:hypothetical protein
MKWKKDSTDGKPSNEDMKLSEEGESDSSDDERAASRRRESSSKEGEDI